MIASKMLALPEEIVRRASVCRGTYYISHHPSRGWVFGEKPWAILTSDGTALKVRCARHQTTIPLSSLKTFLCDSAPMGAELFGTLDYEYLLHLSGLPAGIDASGEASLMVPSRLWTEDGEVILDGEPIREALHEWTGPKNDGRFVPSIDYQTYQDQVRTIHQAIESGDVYEVNLTFELRGKPVEPLSTFRHMIERNPAPYATLYCEPNRQTLSLSPELFFEVSGKKITTRPMKGTRPRHTEEDALILAESKKDRAENMMIVDLCRHDLHSICRKGTIFVERLCEVEAHPAVYQMVSQVSGELSNDNFHSIIKALGPGGSMTGAPKWTATQLIRNIEQRKRGVYSGALGFITQSGDMSWSMGIRLLEQDPEVARVGCGGAVVWDSTPMGEWTEAMLKAQSVIHSMGGSIQEASP